MLKVSIINIALRSLTLVSKFVLMISMVRYYTTEQVGTYGLFTAAITISLYLIGMDFHTYSTREMFKHQQENWMILFRDQIIFHSIVYVFLLPLLLIIVTKILPWNVLGYFFTILIFEHLLQELQRLLINLSKPIQATIVLFLRSGAWVYIIVGMIWMGFNNLSIVWLAWLGGLLFGIITAIIQLRNMNWTSMFTHHIDWKWILRGLRVCVPFLIGTLLLRLIELMDRFIIEYFHGSSLVGIYTFYYSMANVIMTFVYTGVISILFPRIIQAYSESKYQQYHHYMKKLTVLTVNSTVILAICVYFVTNFALEILGKMEYKQYNTAFVILLIAISLNVLSQIPHYGLYVQKKDRSILVSTFVSFITSGILNFLLVPKFGIYGSASSMAISMFVMLCLKGIYLRQGLEAERGH